MMQTDKAILSRDIYVNTKYRTVLLPEQTGVASLAVFGHATNNKAELPMINHYHKDKVEFVIVIDGMQRYTASDVSYTLYGGDVFFTMPNENHSSGQNPQAVNEILWFQLELSSYDNLLGLPNDEAQRLFVLLKKFDARQFQISHKLISQFLESFELLGSDEQDNKIKGRSLFIYCLMDMLKSDAMIQTLTDDIGTAKQYIFNHIKEVIDMDELLGVSKLSVSRFKQKFKEQIGLSPREFINLTKIDKCKAQVAMTKQSITDIAFEYSFSSSNYFCVVFKQFTGYSPKVFRKKFQQGKVTLD